MTKKKKEKKKNIKFLYNLYDVKKWKKKNWRINEDIHLLKEEKKYYLTDVKRDSTAIVCQNSRYLLYTRIFLCLF